MANQKSSKKNSNLVLIIAAIVLVCAVFVVILINEGQKGNDSSGNTQVIAEGDVLRIPTADITSTASFFPIEVDGTQMEVFAIKASDGTIRTAFNTCQSCFTSGAGYYVQEGNYLICQNCGFQFTPDQVEIQSGGCNPWPIFPENKTVTEDSIEIDYEFLSEATIIFANWKR